MSTKANHSIRQIERCGKKIRGSRMKRKKSKVHKCRISDQIFKIDIFNIGKIERIVYKKAKEGDKN